MAKATKHELELTELNSWLELLARHENVPLSRSEPWGLYLAPGPNGQYYIRQNWVSYTGKLIQRPRLFTYAQPISTLVGQLSAIIESYRNVEQMKEVLAELGANS